jgi:soluble cytochrome b562
MNAEGWDVTAQRISVVKSTMKAERKAKKAAPAPTPEATPEVPTDAVSVGLLVKAKKLAAQFGSIEEAKAALNALAQLLD